MSKHPLVMLRALPEELESIAEPALDLRWTWVNSSDRLWKMLEYVETLYLPATKTYRKRAAKDESLVKQLLAWQAALEQHWPSIRFGEVRITREGGLWRFLVSVYLGGLAPAAVRVELYADPEEGQAALCRPLIREEAASTMPGWHVYLGSVKSERPSDHFTPHVVPTHPEAAVPIEAHHIAWARQWRTALRTLSSRATVRKHAGLVTQPVFARAHNA